MRPIKQIHPDGTTTVYASMTEAAEANHIHVQSVSISANFGYITHGLRFAYADGEPAPVRKLRKRSAQARLEAILDVLAPLMGRKEQEVRSFVARKLKGKQVTKEKVHKCFGWWYIHQPLEDVVLMDVSEYIRRYNAL